jgi:hypothetical protein
MKRAEVAQYWEANAETWTRHARAGYDIYRDGLNTPAPTILGAVERLFWARTGNNRAKTQHFRHFWMSISRLSTARARARERQVFRARAESPNAAGGTSGLTDPLLKSKNYSRKLCG